MKKNVAIIGWVLCVLFLALGFSYGGAAVIFYLAAAVLVCPLFRNHVKLPGKLWIPLVVVLCCAGAGTAPQPKELPEETVTEQSTDFSASDQEAETDKSPIDEIKPTEPEQIAEISAEPSISEPETDLEIKSENTAAGAYTIKLGDSDMVTIRKHPVLDGNGTYLFDIGVGETATDTIKDISSGELSAFINALDFESYGYKHIVLSFEDGTGIVFSDDNSSYDYGYVDISSGNFKLTERLGSIQNDNNNWNYITATEPESESEKFAEEPPFREPEITAEVSSQNITAAPSPDTSNTEGRDNNFNTYDNESQQQTKETYVLNTNTRKFHYPSCKSVKKIAPKNYSTSSKSRDELISLGYDPCGICKP